MSKVEIVREAAAKCLAQAGERYGIDTSKVRILFNLRGTCAGQARWTYDRWNKEVGTAELRFNVTMINDKGFDHILNDTVPHEVAHIICAINPRLGKNHDAGWRRVCVALGGSGDRCHTEEVIYAKGDTYSYISTNGNVINVSGQRHAKIQRGYSLRFSKGLGILDNTCQFKLIGRSGRRVADTPEPSGEVVVKTINDTATKVAPKAPVKKVSGKMSKAEQIRDAIRRCKRLGLDRSIAIEYGVDELNMSRSQARKYVNENWDKA